MPRRWIKVPGPGQFRGEGEWEEVAPKDYKFWEEYRATGFLPTAEQDEKPSDDPGKGD